MTVLHVLLQTTACLKAEFISNNGHCCFTGKFKIA